MSRPLRILLIVTVIAAITIGILWWHNLSALGYFTAVRQEVSADCHPIPSVPGPEDIAIDRANGIAFVAATDRRAIMAGAGTIRGGIYIIDLNQPEAQWALRPVTAAEPEDFRPLGISLYVGADGTRRLFAVNQPAGAAQRVEIFDIGADNTLAYVKTVADPLLVSLNDVQAVGPDSFYVTNDHVSKNPTINRLGDFLLLARANVIYYDGHSAHVAADSLNFPDGINISPDGRKLYVGEFFGMALHVYARDPGTGVLTPTDYTRIGTGLDNIDVQPDGALLIAGDPRIPDLIAHVMDPAKLSPSQVVRVEVHSDSGGRAGTIYLNSGKEISGVSVAAGYGDKMLLGNAFDPVILVCKQSKEFKAF